jgi:hypothetical protein
MMGMLIRVSIPGEGRFQMKESLSRWLAANAVGDNMIFRAAAVRQFELLQKLQRCLFAIEDSTSIALRFADHCTNVIGTHTSKSIKLPVVEFMLPRVRLVMRDNFYNWTISVQSDEPLHIDVCDLFDPSIEHSSVYCEGFNEGDVFGSYNSNKREFTVQLRTNDALERFCDQIRRLINQNPKEDPQGPDNPSE